MKSWGYAFFAVPVGLAVFVGCAEAPEDEPLYGILNNDPADAGKGVSIKLPETQEDDDDDTTSSSSSSSSSGAPKDAGQPAPPPKDAGPPPPAPGADPCSKLSCSGAKDLGAMPGDGNSTAKTATGATSRFFTVRVEESADTGIFAVGRSMRVKATLTSPPGHNFDLFVYQPSTAKQCNTVAKASESPTDPDVASIIWGEADGSGGNGGSDTAIVTIEVREITAPTTCDPTATWTLKVEGNKQ